MFWIKKVPHNIVGLILLIIAAIYSVGMILSIAYLLGYEP